MREDAVWASDACRKRAEREPRPARARTRRPTWYRVYRFDLATGLLHPIDERQAHSRDAAIAAREREPGDYVAIPVRSLRLYDEQGRKR